MKKSFFVLLLVVLAVFMQAAPVYADSPEPIIQLLPDGSTVYHFSDGSKLTISAAKDEEESKGTTSTITRSKDATFTNSNNVIEWKYTLHATFTYTYGVSSSCTSTYYSQNIYGGNWTFSDGSATKSGNVAHGVGKYEQKFLFIVLNTVNVDLHLTCDIYGVVT